MEFENMHCKHFRNSHTLLKLSAILLIGLCGSDALAQSGSRSAAPSGSGSRAISQVAPAQSFQQPTATFQSPSQGFSPTQSFEPSQNFATSQNFSSPQEFGTYQTSTPDQPMMQPSVQGSMSGEVNTAGGGSPGIPQSSLVDPIFEMHDPNSAYVVDHSPWDAFLRRYLVTGPSGVNRIKYRQVTTCDQQQLNCYLQRLQSTDIRGELSGTIGSSDQAKVHRLRWPF